MKEDGRDYGRELEMEHRRTLERDVNREKLLLSSNKKLIQMLQALDERAPDDLRAFWKRYSRSKDKSNKSLLQCGMTTRELCKVLGSKFYAQRGSSSSIIEQADELSYIRRIQVKRPTKRRAGNPNLVMNYITGHGRGLLIEVGLREGNPAWWLDY